VGFNIPGILHKRYDIGYIGLILAEAYYQPYRMPFFYSAEKLNQGEVHFLTEQDSRHCIKVLRKKRGDQIRILNGMGSIFKGIITQDDPRKCSFRVIEEEKVKPEDRVVHLAIAPTKNLERIEWLVEKITELGITQISFIQCQNSERNKMNTSRISRKAISAIKQSGNPYLPTINEITSFKAFMNYPLEDFQKFLAHAIAPRPLIETIAASNQNYVVLIGPEGGFSEQEIKEAEINGYERVSLSPQILRTETAGLVASTLLLSK